MSSVIVDKRRQVVRAPSSRVRGEILLLTIAIVVTYAVPATVQSQATQQGGERRAPIVIRGEVPIPQIVTIRPREVPPYHLENLLLPDRHFSSDLGKGYSLIPSRFVGGGGTWLEGLTIRIDSIGTPQVVVLPNIPLVDAPIRYYIAKRQYSWCAPNWWCPTHKVREPIVAEFPADFPRR